ncbi:MAG: gliding motility-associated C-terminal domain-containing protein, partial [Bacteroidota bacterium]
PVTVLGDDIAEAVESFTAAITVSNDNGQPVTIGTGSATATITDDDDITISINNVAINEEDNLQTSFVFTVSLSNASDGIVTVDYATADGTATILDNDYIAIPSTVLTFAPGETSKTITLLVNGDNKVEADETLTVDLRNITAFGYVVTFANSTGTATILNDDNLPVLADVIKTGTEDNDVPFATIDFANVFTDIDGDTLNKINVVSLPQNGTLYLNGIAVSSGDEILSSDINNLIFTPALNWNGSTSFDYNAYDGANWSAIAEQVIINITPINDAPIAISDTVYTLEDNQLNGSVTLNDTDVEGDGLNVTQFIINGTNYGAGSSAVINGEGTIIINANGTYTFTPDNNYNDTVSTVSYVIIDGNGGSDTGNLVIIVSPVNDAPITFNESLNTCSNNALSGNILSNSDSDIEGTSLTVNTIPVVSPLYGNFVIAANGDYTYTPNLTYNGFDQIVVSICDNGSPLPYACTNDTINIVVNQMLTSNAGSSQLLCNVDNITLAANNSAPGTGLWTIVSGPNTPIFGDATLYNTTVTNMIPGDYVFKWTINNGICTPSESTVTITNYATPTIATVGSTQYLCGTLVSESLGGNTPVNGAGMWSQLSGPGTTTFSSPTSGVTTATASNYGTYVYQWTISNGTCSSSTAIDTVNYFETPTVASISNPVLSYCGTLISSNLGANNPAVGTGEWTIVSGGTGNFSDTGDGNSIFTGNAYGTYILRWSITNGTCTPSISDVTINYYETPTIIATSNARCGVGTVDLSATTSVGTINWYDSASNGTLLGSNLTYTTPIISNTTSYWVEAINNGCISASRTEVIATVNPVFNVNTSAQICSGSTYQLGSQALTTSGTYTEVFQTVLGCDSTVNLTLTVNPVYNITASAQICSGSTYQLGSQALTTSGTYTEVFQTVQGCDSTVNLTLTVNPVYNTTTSAQICSGSTYQLGSQALTTSGTYTEVFQTVLGCDSTVNLNLTVNPVYNTTASAQICSGSTYQFGSQLLTTSGIYTEVFQSVSSCDSTVVLTLNVANTITNSIAASICQGNNYILGSQNLTTSGIYNETFVSSMGCDSTVTLTLTVNPVYNEIAEVTITKGESYIFGNQELTEDGVYTNLFTSNTGCDSTVVLTLIVNDLDLNIPQGFSPNGDGVNDLYVIKGISEYPNNTLEIYNRWGNIVYKATNYQNDWDGTSKEDMTVGNERLPSGTYFYLLNLGNDTPAKTGYIYLTR